MYADVPVFSILYYLQLNDVLWQFYLSESPVLQSFCTIKYYLFAVSEIVGGHNPLVFLGRKGYRHKPVKTLDAS